VNIYTEEGIAGLGESMPFVWYKEPVETVVINIQSDGRRQPLRVQACDAMGCRHDRSLKKATITNMFGS